MRVFVSAIFDDDDTSHPDVIRVVHQMLPELQIMAIKCSGDAYGSICFQRRFRGVGGY